MLVRDRQRRRTSRKRRQPRGGAVRAYLVPTVGVSTRAAFRLQTGRFHVKVGAVVPVGAATLSVSAQPLGGRWLRGTPTNASDPVDATHRGGDDQSVRYPVLFAVVVASLVVVTATEGAVRRVSLTSPVRAGNYATLTVNVSPRARCTIRVIYNTTESKVLSANGLGAKTGGTITWRWRMPKDARPGRTPIDVSCGESGMLQAELLVGPVPELPRILSTRLVSGTIFGKAVRVSYCFRSLPRDPLLRPGRLILTVDNLRDDLPPLSHGWEVTKRCGTITHPVGPLQPPYVLRYSVEAVGGTYSNQGLIRLR